MSNIISLNGDAITASKYTNRNLMDAWVDLDRMSRGPLGLILGNRFAQFKKLNLEQYKKINQELLNLQREYCEMESGSGQTLKTAELIKMVKDEKGNMVPSMLPGKTLEDYIAAQDLFLNKKCTIVRPRPMDY